ncbi:MAG: hypothetical protein AAGE59_30650 [Cyanobacteria bacterium P01_F01_bin.86]
MEDSSTRDANPIRKPNISVRHDVHKAVRTYSRQVGRSQGAVIEMAIIAFAEHRPALQKALAEAEEELTA